MELSFVLFIILLGLVLLAILGVLFWLINTSQKKLIDKQNKLYNAVINTQQAEQTRIAQDLHDHIGPLISIVKSQVAAIDTHNMSAIDIELKNNVDLHLQQAVKDIRSIAHNLIPSTFSEYGFVKSIQNYIRRISEYDQMVVNFTIGNWPTNVEKSIEVNIYRILQELFNNSLKHANATIINLKIKISSRNVEILFEDNGDGFDSNALINGIGLKSINNRVNLLKGTLVINSKISNGSTFKLKINL